MKTLRVWSRGIFFLQAVTLCMVFFIPNEVARGVIFGLISFLPIFAVMHVGDRTECMKAVFPAIIGFLMGVAGAFFMVSSKLNTAEQPLLPFVVIGIAFLFAMLGADMLQRSGDRGPFLFLLIATMPGVSLLLDLLEHKHK